MSAKEQMVSRIEVFSRARRTLGNASLRYRLGAYAAGAGILALLFLGGWLPNAFVNVALFGALAVFLLALAVKYLRRRTRFRSHLDEAFRMEELAGTLNSRLISALDFVECKPPTDLMQVVIDRAREDLRLDFEGRMDRKPRDLFRKRCGLLVALLLVIGVTPWFGFHRLASNLRSSLFAVSEYLFPVTYEVTPPYGTHIFRVGREADVGIRFIGRKFREVSLVETVGKETHRYPLRVDESGKAQRRITGLVEARHELHFEFGERVTGKVVLVFANLPVLENMQTELISPAYTRLLPRSLEGIQQRFFGLPGTRMTLGFTFSRELQSATFKWDDGEDLPLEVAGRFASTSLIHSRTRKASLQVEDIYGLNLEYPFPIDFELQEDEPPQVFLPSSLKDEMPVMADGLKLFGFGVRLQDDYGVNKCVLKWTKSTISNPSNVTAKGEIERMISPPRPKAVESFQKIFESLAVTPGDRITFSVEVYDNRTPKNQRTVSPSKSLFVYQQELEDLKIASLQFGAGTLMRERIAKSKRATSVQEPMATHTTEKVRNEYEAEINTTTRAPVVPGGYARPVKDYFKLISSAVQKMAPGEGER